MGSREMSFGRKLSTQAMDGAGTENTSTTISRKVFAATHLLVSLGIILAADQFLKQAFVAASIKFPSALFGMFCIFSLLMILDSVVPAAATGMMNFFEPAFLFIQRWLPLFYVPSLVVLPLSLRDIPAASGVKICYIVGIQSLSCSSSSFHSNLLFILFCLISVIKCARRLLGAPSRICGCLNV